MSSPIVGRLVSIWNGCANLSRGQQPPYMMGANSSRVRGCGSERDGPMDASVDLLPLKNTCVCAFSKRCDVTQARAQRRRMRRVIRLWILLHLRPLRCACVSCTVRPKAPCWIISSVWWPRYDLIFDERNRAHLMEFD